MSKPSTSDRGRRLWLLALKLAVSVALLFLVASQITWHDQLVLPDGSAIEGRFELPADITPGETPVPAVLVDAAGERHTLEDGNTEGGGKAVWGLASYLQHARLGLLAVGVLLICLPSPIVSVRLWLLMRAARVGLSLWRVFVATLAGNFFSLLLPGITGGDVPKAILVARDARAKAEGVAMLVADRAIGALALLVIGALAALSRLVGGDASLTGPDLGKPGLTLLGLSAVVVIGGVVYVAGPLRRLLRIERILAALPLGSLLSRMDEAMRTALAHPPTLLAALGLSLLSHSITIISWTCFVRGFGQTAPLSSLAVYVPLILVISTLPISFGGWGVRETAAATLFAAAGMASEVSVAVSVLYQAAYTLWALPGGALVVMLRRAAVDAGPGVEVAGEERGET